MNLKDKLPRIYWGFPVGPEEPSCQNGVEADRSKSRGVALMIAIMIISIMIMFATDFIVSASVDLTLATSQRDNIRAEYVAKSGANWAIWLNLFDYGLDLQFAASKDPGMTQTKAAIGPLWDKLNEIFPFDSPLDLTVVDTLAKAFGLSGFMDSAVIGLLKNLGGEIGVDVSDESGKINLNSCYRGKTECKFVVAQLQALMSCTPIEQDYMRDHNAKPSELAARVQDWIRSNNTADPASGYSDANDPYKRRTPSHTVKNSPMDSVEELKVIEGWTDEIYTYFSPYLTVFPFTYQQDPEKASYKLNVNAFNQEALHCFFSRELSSPEAHEKFVRKYKELMEKDGRLAADDKALDGVIRDLFGYKVDGTDKASENDRSSWFTTQSHTYRIRGKGIVGTQTRIVEYVLERQTVAQHAAINDRPVWRFDWFRMN